MKADIRSFFGRLPHLFRNDFTAVLLVVANIYPGVSFFVNFIGGREFETIAWDDQMGKPILRAVPMWIAAIAGGIVGDFFGSAILAAVFFVLPVKLSLDVFGHFAEHGMLRLDEIPTEDSNR